MLLQEFLKKTGRVLDSIRPNVTKFSFTIHDGLEPEFEGVLLIDLDLSNSHPTPTITLCCKTEHNCALWNTDLTYEILESEFIAAGLIIVEKEEDFLNFADYFANAIKNKETSYTITKHIDSAVTLNLNLHYDMGSYNPVGNIKMRLVQANLDSSVLKMMHGLNNLYKEEKNRSEEFRISSSAIQSPKAHTSDLGKRSLPEGSSSSEILVGVNNEGIKVESVKIELGNTADVQIDTLLSKDPVKNKKYIDRKKTVHRIF